MKQASLFCILFFNSIISCHNNSTDLQERSFSMSKTPQATKEELEDFFRHRASEKTTTRKPTASQSREEATANDKQQLEDARKDKWWYTKVATGLILLGGAIALIITNIR